jgi:hypothetical protein
MFWWVILGTVAVVLVIAWLYDRSRAGRSGVDPDSVARARRRGSGSGPADSGGFGSGGESL